MNRKLTYQTKARIPAVMILGILFLFAGCDSGDSTDVLVTDFGAGLTVQLPENKSFIALSEKIDLNRDGYPDYLIQLLRFQKDDIYYHENVFYISLQASTTFLQKSNPFEPIVFVDNSQPVRSVGSILSLNMIRFNQMNDAIDDLDHSYYEAFVSKTDEYETIQPEGHRFIPVLMTKAGKNHYGWIEVSLNQNSITIQRTGFCKTPDKKINVGQID